MFFTLASLLVFGGIRSSKSKFRCDESSLCVLRISQKTRHLIFYELAIGKINDVVRPCHPFVLAVALVTPLGNAFESNHPTNEAGLKPGLQAKRVRSPGFRAG